jgi:hypothetical protein
MTESILDIFLKNYKNEYENELSPIIIPICDFIDSMTNEDFFNVFK